MAVKINNDVVEFRSAEARPLSAVAYVQDKATEAQLKDLLPKWGYGRFQVTRGGVPDAIDKFASETLPSVLIIDISATTLPLSDLERLARICPPNVNVVVLGDRDNVGLYRDLMEIGVTDYLVKPVPSDLLYKAVGKASGQINSRPADHRMGKTVSVVGVRGGVGATTTVFNIGWLLSTVFNRHVVLNDLNLSNGSLALEMGVEPTSGLSELLTHPQRIDDVFVDRATLHVGHKLRALVSECELDAAPKFDEQAVAVLTNHLRSHCHFIIQDVIRTPGDLSAAILKQSDVRILVMDCSLAAVRDCARLLTILNADDENVKTLIVLNRTRLQSVGDVPLPKIEKFIGRPIDVVIPFEKKKLAMSSLMGEPIVRRKSPMSDAFKLLAQELIGQRTAKNQRSWLAALRGR